MLTSIASCNYSDKLYHSFLTTPTGGWDWGDTLTFNIPEAEHTSPYYITIEAKANSKYPYQQLWLIVQNDFRHPGRLVNDTICINITDKNGYYTGQGINIYQFHTLLGRYLLHKGHTYQIRIVHSMRQGTVKGVTNIGLECSRRPPRID